MFKRPLKFLADLFKGPNNAYWDLGRILAFVSIFGMLAGQIWNMILGQPIDLGPGGLGGGIAAVATAVAALIAAKDIASAKARGNTPHQAEGE